MQMELNICGTFDSYYSLEYYIETIQTKQHSHVQHCTAHSMDERTQSGQNAEHFRWKNEIKNFFIIILHLTFAFVASTGNHYALSDLFDGY